MALPESLDAVSGLVRRYQSEGRTVELVDVGTTGPGGEASLTATVDVSVPLCPSDGAGEAALPASASVDDDGRLHVSYPSSVAPTAAEHDAVSVRETSGRVADGTVVVTLDLVVDAAAKRDDGAAGRSPAAADANRPCAGDASGECEAPAGADDGGLAAVRNDDLPPYQDTEYLQYLYDSFDTFAEMGEHIEMDVATETVRRYMIDAGVHVPESYDTGGVTDCEHGGTDADSEERGHDADADADEWSARRDGAETDDRSVRDVTEKQVVTDGVGLPDHIRVEDVVQAVVDSMTLYDVQRALDLERREAKSLLEQLDLLDLVMRRVSQDPEQPPEYEQVTKRIRECATGTA